MLAATICTVKDPQAATTLHSFSKLCLCEWCCARFVHISQCHIGLGKPRNLWSIAVTNRNLDCDLQLLLHFLAICHAHVCIHSSDAQLQNPVLMLTDLSICLAISNTDYSYNTRSQRFCTKKNRYKGYKLFDCLPPEIRLDDNRKPQQNSWVHFFDSHLFIQLKNLWLKIDKIHIGLMSQGFILLMT